MDEGTLAGVRILSPETVGEALRPGYTEGYGLHWELYRGSPAGAKLPAFGHGGSDGTIAIAYPYADAMILFFTQSRGARGPWQDAMQRLPSLVGMEGAVRYPEPRTSGRNSTSYHASPWQELTVASQLRLSRWTVNRSIGMNEGIY